MNKTLRTSMAWIVLLTFTTACTSMYPITATNEMSWQAQLQVGDEVQLRRNDGSEALFTIEQLDAEGISGGGIVVAYTDIGELTLRKTSAGKSILLGVGILLGMAVLALASIDEDDIFGSN